MKNFICYKVKSAKKIILEEFSTFKLNEILNKAEQDPNDVEILAIHFNGNLNDFAGYEIILPKNA